MKSLLYIFLTTALLSISTMVQAQISDLEIQLDVSYAEDTRIIIEIEGGNPGYTSILFNREPWEGSQPIETSKESDLNTHSFIVTKSDTYYVCVMDADDNMACRKIEVEVR